MVIDDDGVVEVGVAWVVKGWVYWYGSGFAIMGVGLGLPPWVASSFVCVCVCVCVCVNGRLWVASGGGVRCV